MCCVRWRPSLVLLARTRGGSSAPRAGGELGEGFRALSRGTAGPSCCGPRPRWVPGAGAWAWRGPGPSSWAPGEAALRPVTAPCWKVLELLEGRGGCGWLSCTLPAPLAGMGLGGRHRAVPLSLCLWAPRCHWPPFSQPCELRVVSGPEGTRSKAPSWAPVGVLSCLSLGFPVCERGGVSPGPQARSAGGARAQHPGPLDRARHRRGRVGTADAGRGGGPRVWWSLKASATQRVGWGPGCTLTKGSGTGDGRHSEVSAARSDAGTVPVERHSGQSPADT